MAKKKTSAKKVVSKAAKATAPKARVAPPLAETKAPAPPKSTEAKTAPPAAPLKPRAAPLKATLAAKKKVEPKGSRGSWPEKDKGYPDPFHVSSEGKTATDRIFVMKKDQYIWDIYGTRKIIIPLG